MQQLDWDLLECLVLHVRILAFDQVARAWFPHHRGALRQTRRHLERLQHHQFVQTREVLARPIVPLTGPLAQWQHTRPAPDFDAISRYLRRRARARAVSTPITIAAARARVLWGAQITEPCIKLTQTTHDLHVAEVFLSYRRHGTAVGQWVGEDRLPKSWPLRQRPDALLVDRAGYFLRAIEYGGDYSSDRLWALHRALAALPLAYEIW